MAPTLDPDHLSDPGISMVWLVVVGIYDSTCGQSLCGTFGRNNRSGSKQTDPCLDRVGDILSDLYACPLDHDLVPGNKKSNPERIAYRDLCQFYY